MAALFWSWKLGAELLIAAGLAWLWADAQGSSAVVAGALTIGVFVGLQLLFAVAALLVAWRESPARWQLADAKDLLRATFGEVAAFPLAQLAMVAEPWLPLRDVPVPPAGTRVRPVLLIHGLLCNRAVWKRVHSGLRAAGFAPIRAVNVEPLGADIEAFAAVAARELAAMHRDSGGAAISIVGHSLGGLVARALLRSADSRAMARIVTVGTPHHGAAHARWLPWAAARQLRPESRWLRELNAEQEGSLAMPLTSLHSRDDSLIAPATSPVLKGAETRELRGLGHFGLLRSRRAIRVILDALAAA